MRVRACCAAAAVLAALWRPAAAQTVADLFKQVNRSVVVVFTKGTDLPASSDGQPVSVAGLGSGVLISADGAVLTAAHVVQTADAVAVQLDSGEVVAAKVVSSAPSVDVALLKLERTPKGLVAVARLGDSDAVEVGDPVFIIGAPLGMGRTLTV